MSTSAYNRFANRDHRIWVPFVHSFPFALEQITDRMIIFGLYSYSYINQQIYLLDIESDDLANLLNDYNTKIAELTNQEQIVVAEIVSKRYLASVDKVIHDQKMATKTAELESEDDLWDAKIAALASDQAVLTTLAIKVDTETDKTQARIAELQAYIVIEACNLSEADIQVVEKEIQSSKVDIEKLNVANAILKIQIEVIETALRTIDVDLQMARARVDISETDININKINLLNGDLLIERARTIVAQSELKVAEARYDLSLSKGVELDKENAFYSVTLPAQESTDLTNRLSALEIKQTIRIDALAKRAEEKQLGLDHAIDDSGLLTTFADDDSEEQIYVDGQKILILGNKVTNVKTKSDAAIAVAETLAAANITTTLTHTIAKRAES